MAVNDFAVIGLNNTGRSIALNMKDRQYSVAVYDEDFESTQKFADDCRARAKAYRDMKSLVTSLTVPRKIFLCIDNDKSDEMISQLEQYLNRADTIIDMSEGCRADAKVRYARLSASEIRYLDVAITGPYDGITSGAGVIAGGDEESFSSCARILRQLSKEHKGFSSCIHSGASGTGFYTKMVHDAIEISLMQVIADGYFMLRSLTGMKCEEIGSAFTFINEGLNLYLLTITSYILQQYDEESGTPIIDFIIDDASVSKSAGYGLRSANETRTPALIFAEAVFMRHLSGLREERRDCVKKLYAPSVRYEAGSVKLLDVVKDAVKASLIIGYAQGMGLLGADFAGGQWNYGEDEVGRVWSGSSTIGSNYLTRAQIAYNSSDRLLNLMNDDYFSNHLSSLQKGFRETVMLAAKHGVPAPSFMSALSYYDSMRTQVIPANLLQSQLNYMRRDTVKRYDIQGNFNVDWVVDDKKKSPPQGRP